MIFFTPWANSLKPLYFISIACVLFLSGCTIRPHGSPPAIHPKIIYSDNRMKACIKTDSNLSHLDSLIYQVGVVSGLDLLNAYSSLSDDSIKFMMASVIESELDPTVRSYHLTHVEKDENLMRFLFLADTARLKNETNRIVNTYPTDFPIEPLFHREGQLPDFLSMQSPRFILPCKNIPVPKKASRLPNAPRRYRYGIHRGIDFFSNWGTPVRAVADGVIIRSDLAFKEVEASFRNHLLHQAKTLNRTPSDIFNSVLLGKSIIIDHGFNLFPGYRTITLYAHLSHIDSKCLPGKKIKQGEIFARSGNSGTKESTEGSRGASHLHWELLLQDAKGEYYFGQGLPYSELYPSLNRLFK